MTLVKICGIRDVEEALAAAEAGAWAVGEVFAPSSRQIKPDIAAAINHQLGGRIMKVGVFADQPIDYVREVARVCQLDLIQLHGSEEPDYVKAVGLPVIKSFRVGNGFELPSRGRWPVFAFLFDTYHPEKMGGCGQTFDWGLVEGFEGRFILAGGLNPDNVADAVSRLHPFAVDVSSGVERSGGGKDKDRIMEFVCRVKEASGCDS